MISQFAQQPFAQQPFEPFSGFLVLRKLVANS
jgi:hypothetical protein